MTSNHELQATLNALGYLEDGQYYKSRDCLSAAKDLVRFIRRDDPNEKAIRRELLKTDVLSNDLVPLMKSIKSKKDAELFDIALRLTVNLTQSAFNCFEMKLPEDKAQFNIYTEIDNRLRQTKEKFADDEFIELINAKLDEITSKEWEDRPEEEDLVAERLLFLIRNILLIKTSDDSEKRLETDLNSHDLLILSFHKAKLLDTLVKMSKSPSHLKYSVHLLEIFSLILKEQSAEELARVSENECNMLSKRSQLEKEKDNHELIKIQLKDDQLRKHSKIRMNPRHSRFMGTYVATNVKSINDENKLIVHKPARNMDDLLDDSNKKVIRKAKNKMAHEDIDSERKSVLFIRVILKKFCAAILKDSYKVLFSNLKDLMQRKQVEDDEITYFYWLVRFLLEFNRNTDLDEQTKLDQIRETFSPSILHSSEIFIQRCIEMMRVDKKTARLWAKRAHTCLRCYKETLITLYVFEKNRLDAEKKADVAAGSHLRTIDTNKEYASEEDRLADLAEGQLFGSEAPPASEDQSQPPKQLFDDRSIGLLEKLKNDIFYVQEFREMFIKLLKEYDQAKYTQNFLRDLVEGNHIFLMMLETEMKRKGGLSVGSKKKQRKKSAKSKKKETKEEKAKRQEEDKEFQDRLDEQDAAFKEKIWQAHFPKVASLMQNESELEAASEQLMPTFDIVATSDQEFDAHKDKVIEKIQHLLSAGKVDDSIALFREARCLWPNDKETFGKSSEMEADEEFEVFKNLFMRTLELKKPEKPAEEVNENDDEGIEDDMAEQAAGSEDEEDEERLVVTEENLDFDKFVFQFTHPHVLKSYMATLGAYAKNSDFLNRCCMSMLERIAYDCKMPQCLYQARLFALVNQMYKDPLSRTIMNIMDDAATTQHLKAIDTIYASTYTAEDMFAFFRQLLAKFFAESAKNPKLFCELLFFKDKRKIAELTDDPDDKLILTTKASRKVAWTEEERDELVELFNRFKGKLDQVKKRKEDPEAYLADDQEEEELEGDLVDQVMVNMKDGSRKRKEVCNQLVNLGCLRSLEEAKCEEYQFSSRKLGRSRMWRPEDVEDLRQCFQLVKSESEQTKQPLGDMMSKLKTLLKVKRDKMTIVLKLCDLGLADSKHELLTKSKKSKKSTASSRMSDFLAENSDHEDQDRQQERPKKKKKDKKKKSAADDDIFAADSSSDEVDDSSSDSGSSSSDDEQAGEKDDQKSSSHSSRSSSPVKSTKSSQKLASDDEGDLELTERLMELAKPASSSSESGRTGEKKTTTTKKRKKELAAEPKPPRKKKVKVLASSSENSNSSDDVPLSAVKKRAKPKRASQINLDDDDDDDEEASKPVEDDDDEDRMPGSLQLNDSTSSEAEAETNKKVPSDDDDEDEELLKPAASSKKQRLILSDEDE